MSLSVSHVTLSLIYSSILLVEDAKSNRLMGRIRTQTKVRLEVVVLSFLYRNYPRDLWLGPKGNITSSFSITKAGALT